MAYADWLRAQCSPVAQVLHFACTRNGVLLIDTFVKDGTNLLDWLSEADLRLLEVSCRQAGVRLRLRGRWVSKK